MMKTPCFSHTFTSLPDFFYERVQPTPLEQAKLIHVTELREKLGLDYLTDESLKQWLNGELELSGEQRIASRYAGHQFGVWAGQLGDGRAISLGEILTPEGRLEIQTKGSGLTPFSRMGDGKAVIRSSVREYLCSEAMHGLGIPTTRVLALLTGEDHVQREALEKSALVARVFTTNLRFGHFEMAFHFDKKDELKALIQYTQKNFFEGLSIEKMLSEIVGRTARLMAQWMCVGFSHGVMNTDNMSILGLTIDYGPFGFMEDTLLTHVCNHSDHQGRYAFHQQPSIGMWNLERLLVCFMSEVPKQDLEKILSSYPKIFEEEYLRLSRNKLGLMKAREGDAQLYRDLLMMMHQTDLDFTHTFRSLSSYKKSQNLNELGSWLEKYEERLSYESSSDLERETLMKSANPKYVLKNYIAQEVIQDVEAGKSGRLSAWMNVLKSPFDEHPDFESYAGPTPPEHKNYVVSCSS